MKKDPDYKKREERKIVREFISRFSPYLLNHLKDSESPDFITKNEQNKIIGIEITKIYRKKRDREKREINIVQQREERWHLAFQACELWTEENNPPIEVHLFFNIDYPLSKKKINKIAKLLVDLVKKNIPNPGCSKILSNDENNNINLPKEITGISIYRFSENNNVNKSYWFPVEADYIEKLDPEYLQELINKKNEKVSEYRKKCNEIWLLMIIDTMNISSLLEISEEIHETYFKSSFDRIFIFDKHLKSFKELKLINKVNND